MTALCPECSGPQLPDGHPKGVIGFDHDRATCSLGRAEDSTADADFRRAAGWLGPFARPITQAELTLLAVVGVDAMTVEPHTYVTPITPGILRRHWKTKEKTA